MNCKNSISSLKDANLNPGGANQLFVEVKINLLDSKYYLIKCNFQLLYEHLVHAAISGAQQHTALQCHKISPLRTPYFAKRPIEMNVGSLVR